VISTERDSMDVDILVVGGGAGPRPPAIAVGVGQGAKKRCRSSRRASTDATSANMRASIASVFGHAAHGLGKVARLSRVYPCDGQVRSRQRARLRRLGRVGSTSGRRLVASEVHPAPLSAAARFLA